MLELELQQYLLREYPQENARCEWKEFKNLKNSFCGDEKDDVISYVSAIANMEGGHLVIGVKDKTLEIVGTDISRLTFNGQPANTQSATFKLTEQCTYLSSEGLSIEEFITDDTNKRVWIIHIPKHLPRRPVLAHKKAWQRIEDSLVELTQERMAVILEEPIYAAKDWSAEIVPDATIDDLDEVAIAKARMMFKKVHSRICRRSECLECSNFFEQVWINEKRRYYSGSYHFVGQIRIRFQTAACCCTGYLDTARQEPGSG